MPLTIIELILRIILVAIEGQPPDVKAELWKLYLQDVKEWRAFFEKVKLTGPSA